MRFTEQQQKAVDARNPKVLVSAAAGSGKTTVLIERVLSLMREGIPVERMLVVTFTRASAADMRSKLISALDKSTDPMLKEQALSVNRASICTLHVLCNRLIRAHFQAAGIDPLSRIAEKYQTDPLYERAYEQVMENICDDPAPDERQLLDSFSPEQIRKMTDSCRSFMEASADPDAWAAGAVSQERAGLYLREIRRQALLMLSEAKDLLERMEKILYQSGGPLPYEKSFLHDRDRVQRLEEDLSSDQSVFDPARYEKINIGTISKKNDQVDPVLKERYSDLRKKLTATVDRILSCLPAAPEAFEKEYAFTLPVLTALIRITRSTQQLFFLFKKQMNLLEYNDLEHLALKVLDDERILRSVRSGIDAVFVDECQDITALQDAIISKLTGPDTLCFMVGDVKQSIYRFRLAEPSLFQDKYRRFSFDEEAPERKIVLQQNFRSSRNILSCVNHVFSGAMRENATELSYDREAELHPADQADDGPAVELVIFRKEQTDEAASEEDKAPGKKNVPSGAEDSELTFGYRYEAAWCAKRIRKLVREGLPGKDGTKEAVHYRDIAVLLRSASGKAPIIAKLLSDAGIPVYCDADRQFYDLPEVSDVMSILRVIDNPFRDIPLLATLHCPCFSFTNRELAQIRLHSKKETAFYTLLLKKAEEDSPLGQKIRSALEVLQSWRSLSGQIPVEGLILLILKESELYIRAGTLEDGDLRQADLRLLAEQASAMEDPFDLHAFLDSVEKVRVSDDEKTAKAIGENEDVVCIMTMHKSKGLEFNTVFLMNLAQNFRSDNDQALFDPVLGGTVAWIDPEKRTKKETMAMNALKLKKKNEQRAEECRLLYVAMTRAKKKLIMLASPKKSDPAVWDRPLTDATAASAACMLDWICYSLSENIQPGENLSVIDSRKGRWDLIWPDVRELDIRGKKQQPDFEPDGTRPGSDTVYYMQRGPAALSPVKLSVSGMVKLLRSEEDMEETPRDKRVSELPAPRPSFLEEEKPFTAAEKGTITHKCLGAADFELLRSEGTESVCLLLRAQGILSDAEYRALDKNMISRFFESGLGKRVLASSLVRREWPFNLLLSDSTILQGVIDLCFMENGEWVLCDYKTDLCEPEELRERYSCQLNCYRKALQVITGTPVRQALLFSLRHGREIEVPYADPFVDNPVNI